MTRTRNIVITADSAETRYPIRELEPPNVPTSNSPLVVVSTTDWLSPQSHVRKGNALLDLFYGSPHVLPAHGEEYQGR